MNSVGEANKKICQTARARTPDDGLVPRCLSRTATVKTLKANTSATNNCSGKIKNRY